MKVLPAASYFAYQSECGDHCSKREALGFRFDYSDLAGTKIGGLFFGGKKWVRSLSSCENMWSRVVSRNLNL
jgi:hypothetical protein